MNIFNMNLFNKYKDNIVDMLLNELNKLITFKSIEQIDCTTKIPFELIDM